MERLSTIDRRSFVIRSFFIKNKASNLFDLKRFETNWDVGVKFRAIILSVLSLFCNFALERTFR